MNSDYPRVDWQYGYSIFFSHSRMVLMCAPEAVLSRESNSAWERAICADCAASATCVTVVTPIMGSVPFAIAHAVQYRSDVVGVGGHERGKGGGVTGRRKNREWEKGRIHTGSSHAECTNGEGRVRYEGGETGRSGRKRIWKEGE